jgi:CelD/BcsL family acetyltransferase involved in cellulose biosynthesis
MSSGDRRSAELSEGLFDDQSNMKADQIGIELQIGDQSNHAKNDLIFRSSDVWLTPFQQSSWLDPWQLKIGNGEDILPITAILTFKGQPIAILPLAVFKSRKLKVLAWHAFAQSDYCAPIVNRNYLNEFFAIDFEYILKQIALRITNIDLVYLTKQPMNIAGRRNPLRLSTGFDYHVGSHAINFISGETWENFLARKRSPSTLRQLRKKERQLAAFGEVGFRVASTSDDARAIAEHCLSAKSRQLAMLGHNDPFSSPAVRGFLIDFFADGIGHSTWATALTLNGEMLATSVGMASQNEWLLYQMAMDGDHVSNCSPGSLLFSRIMQHCVDSRIERLDLSLGDERYKLEWCDEHESLHTSVLPVTLKGKLAAPILRVRGKMIKFIASNPRLYEHGKALKQRMRALGMPI